MITQLRKIFNIMYYIVKGSCTPWYLYLHYWQYMLFNNWYAHFKLLFNLWLHRTPYWFKCLVLIFNEIKKLCSLLNLTKSRAYTNAASYRKVFHRIWIVDRKSDTVSSHRKSIEPLCIGHKPCKPVSKRRRQGLKKPLSFRRNPKQVWFVYVTIW